MFNIDECYEILSDALLMLQDDIDLTHKGLEVSSVKLLGYIYFEFLDVKAITDLVVEDDKTTFLGYVLFRNSFSLGETILVTGRFTISLKVSDNGSHYIDLEVNEISRVSV